jgi:hypothetical protein
LGDLHRECILSGGKSEAISDDAVIPPVVQKPERVMISGTKSRRELRNVREAVE